MSESLHALLERLERETRSQSEKGTKFEQATMALFRQDRSFASQFQSCWTYKDWVLAHPEIAQSYSLKTNDTGIDLVAEDNAGNFAAIQCKFYPADHVFQKSDLDSFFAASGKAAFSERIVVHSTNGTLGKNLDAQVKNATPPIRFFGLDKFINSSIDWTSFGRAQEVQQRPRKEPREHQQMALDAVAKAFETEDRGKLIMACGTGKTYTALMIAEQLAGPGKTVLFLVPSLALMSQTITEWKNDASTDFRAFAVCSDTKVGKRHTDNDLVDLTIHDLVLPATTDGEKLAEKFGQPSAGKLTVVFSTYQSIQAVSDAQLIHGIPDFDLIICDEAHRTTGAKLDGEDGSDFIKVHDQSIIRGNKRLYMTATPRIFGEDAKKKAKGENAVLASMDDEATYGPVIFERGFAWAVEQDLLTDYKVIVLAVDEGVVAENIQSYFASGGELPLNDATLIVGCYKALAKYNLADALKTDERPMQRALAFCKSVKSSKNFQQDFAKISAQYAAAEAQEIGYERPLSCELQHVDGTMNAAERGIKLDWLKEDFDDDTCRILTNARCLSEGVDVPALDAIMFLSARKSPIDVIQSVGRVMRKAPGKKMGYVIIPITIAPGVTPEEALGDNQRYEIVWKILNALRAHDERLGARFAKAELGEDGQIRDVVDIVGITEDEREATTAVVKDLPTRSAAEMRVKELGGDDLTTGDETNIATKTDRLVAEQLKFRFDDFSKGIMAKLAKKVGTRAYWEDWATDIADIAQRHITRITAAVTLTGSVEEALFTKFLAEIQDDLNPSVTADDAIEMLAQHLITKPVFQALFADSRFADRNPVSIALDAIVTKLEGQNIASERESLDRFYQSVQRRAAGLETASAKQKLIVQLYDKFFKKAFPRTVEKLGIVYTPIEVVDFIIHSVNDVLQEHFGQTLGAKGVHILDPFTGTGTFITRLLQSGLIKPEELQHKYRHELHANEFILLAYYIAAVNIEAVYEELSQGDYEPFEGICLTDTFQMFESDDLIADILPDNSDRRKRQKAQDIRVIMGNPPYSAGQESANDNNANVSYPSLDGRIRDTYAQRSTANNKNALYDSYIRAIRWASDRIGDAGVVAFVTNAGWLDGNAADGMRACLVEEFSDLYIFHLRGNARTSGETRRKEKGNVFGEGSRAPVSINVLIKNPASTGSGQIHFRDIGDYLSQHEKLQIIAETRSINGISQSQQWEEIQPDDNNDWLDQVDMDLKRFPILGDKKKVEDGIFHNYSSGVKTQRDAWAYNASAKGALRNMGAMIDAFNTQVDRTIELEREGQAPNPITPDPRKISWTRALVADFERKKKINPEAGELRPSLYRPFQMQWLYFDRRVNEMIYQMPKLFPFRNAGNRFIQVSGVGARAGFSVLMSSYIPSLDTIEKGQCFPLYAYEPEEGNKGDLLQSLSKTESGYQRKDGITDEALKHFCAAYPGQNISKEDLFYYIYGLLHSEDYRAQFKNNLAKELPRIPAVKSAEDFWAFSKAGRALGELHVNFETVAPYPVEIEHSQGDAAAIDDPVAYYRVTKMKYAGKRGSQDRSTLIYNPNITLKGIPVEAYDYVVNGKSALDWVVERQSVKTDKASGITNDANDYANETMNNPAYPLELFCRVITVSLETTKIVRSLPDLDID